MADNTFTVWFEYEGRNAYGVSVGPIAPQGISVLDLKERARQAISGISCPATELSLFLSEVYVPQLVRRALASYCTKPLVLDPRRWLTTEFFHRLGDGVLVIHKAAAKPPVRQTSGWSDDAMRKSKSLISVGMTRSRSFHGFIHRNLVDTTRLGQSR
eukprot:m51a1_g10474 hypothetical protein (157) ;mRNA; r:86671-92937